MTPEEPNFKIFLIFNNKTRSSSKIRSMFVPNQFWRNEFAIFCYTLERVEDVSQGGRKRYDGEEKKRKIVYNALNLN